MIKVAYHHTQAPNGGFGVLGKGFYKALKKHPDINLIQYNEEVYDDLIPDIVFTYGTPEQIYNKLKIHGPGPLHVHYFVWESSHLPTEWFRSLKIPDTLLTAAQYTQKAAKRIGLEANILHHAVDDRFQYREPKNDGIFTFLHHNAYEFRKGWEVVLEAFTKEFSLDEPVKLIMKARERKHSVWLLPARHRMTPSEYKLWQEDRQAYIDQLSLGHPLIEEKIGHLTDEEMVNMNAEADCFLFPAKGEGWGLPPFEAAAMGIVPILPNKGSFAEWFNDECMIDVGISGYINVEPRYNGYMHQVSTNSLRKKMRWAFNNQDKIKEMGVACSEYIHKYYNWEVVTEVLYQEFINTLNAWRSKKYIHKRDI